MYIPKRKSELYLKLIARADTQDNNLKRSDSTRITAGKIGGTGKANKRIRMREKKDAIEFRTCSAIDKRISRTEERQALRQQRKRERELKELGLLSLAVHEHILQRTDCDKCSGTGCGHCNGLGYL